MEVSAAGRTLSASDAGPEHVRMCSRGGELGGGGKSRPCSSQEEVSFPRGGSGELERLRGLERAGESFRAALRRAKWEKTEDSGGTSGRCPFPPADLQLRSEGRCRAVAAVRNREETTRSAGGDFGGRQRCGGSAASGPPAGAS